MFYRLSKRALFSGDLKTLFFGQVFSKYNTKNMVVTEVRHLRKGDHQPSLKKGYLRLYSMRFCPYAQRVHLVLDAKKIKYDTVNVDLTEKPDWIFLKSGPTGKVPAIEFDNGDTLYESLIVSEYLDEAYPGRKLSAADPLQRARDKILMEQFNQVINNFYKIMMHNNFNNDTMESIKKGLDLFESEITTRGTAFLGGERPGMLDLMIWPWCERADILNLLGGDLYKLPKDRFPKILKWRQSMIDDEDVKISYITPQNHVNFWNSRASGHPNYDLLLSKM